MPFSTQETGYMQRALALAENGRFGAHPNPMVGCVLVKDEHIVGTGWHALAGGPHAEVVALQAAGEQARGATAYVTLEPCSHQGKTGPCCDALITAGVSRVVVARQDPNPAVNGAGIARLQAAGIQVSTGLLADQSAGLLAGFLSRITRGRPRVRLKTACSIDGAIAMASGESQWITGPEARHDVQRLRAGSGAVLTGIGTVLADDPALTVRVAAFNPHERQPLRVVVDSNLRTPASAQLFSLPGETVVYCCDSRNAAVLSAAGADVVAAPSSNGQVDLAAVLGDLGRREVNDVLVEAGPRLGGELLQRGLVDELIIYQAPQLLGSETQGMFRTPLWRQLADRRRLDIIDAVQLGEDRRLTATIAPQTIATDED